MACQTLSKNDPVTIDLGPNLSFKRLAEPDRLLAAANWPEPQHVPKGTHHSSNVAVAREAPDAI